MDSEDQAVDPARRRLIRAAGSGALIGVVGGGCATTPGPCVEAAPRADIGSLQGYDCESFCNGRETRRVYSRGRGPGVILMHELPGLTAETVAFGNWIAARDFRVVMPLLFGEPLQPVGNAAQIGLDAVELCVRHEFRCLSSRRASPVTDWLRALCRHVHDERGGPGIGVIGMCFTGGFVLTMMLEPSVIAPVSAQPTLPLPPVGGLGIDPDDLRQVVARAREAPLLALRFRDDWRCRPETFRALHEAYGDSPDLTLDEVPCGGHSTLTFDYPLALARGHDTRRRVFEHLARRLRGAD